MARLNCFTRRSVSRQPGCLNRAEIFRGQDTIFIRIKRKTKILIQWIYLWTLLLSTCSVQPDEHTHNSPQSQGKTSGLLWHMLVVVVNVHAIWLLKLNWCFCANQLSISASAWLMYFIWNRYDLWGALIFLLWNFRTLFSFLVEPFPIDFFYSLILWPSSYFTVRMPNH